MAYRLTSAERRIIERTKREGESVRSGPLSDAQPVGARDGGRNDNPGKRDGTQGGKRPGISDERQPGISGEQQPDTPGVRKSDAPSGKSDGVSLWRSALGWIGGMLVLILLAMLMVYVGSLVS